MGVVFAVCHAFGSLELEYVDQWSTQVQKRYLRQAADMHATVLCRKERTLVRHLASTYDIHTGQLHFALASRFRRKVGALKA
eukprot:6174588-Amphidinium_carterae.1